MQDAELFSVAFARGCTLDLQAPVLGQGSFGVVRRGEHSASRAACAVKSLAASSEGAQEEARTLSLFAGHPHVVSLLDSFSTCERVHLVMELCAGGDLGAYLEKGALEDGVTSMFMEQLLSAIAFVHRMGFVHCDVKPANVMLSIGMDGMSSVRLSDFGLTERCPAGARAQGGGAR